MSRLIAEVLEVLRWRTDDDWPLRLDFEHCEAALRETVGREAEQSVDAGEPARVEDCFSRERLAARLARQHCGERCRIVAERSETRRGVAIGGAEAVLEILPRFRRGGGVPAADQGRFAADVRGVPQAAAE